VNSFWNTVMPLAPRLSRIAVDGLETRVLEVGPLEPDPEDPDADETVMLVHGASGHLESFILSLPFLARRRRTVAFDLPCHGFADCPDKPFAATDHARYLAGLAAELGVEKVSLVGQSVGGAIAARATVDRLLDVRRLVLIGAAGLSSHSETSDHANTMKSALKDRSFEVVKARLEYAMLSRGPVMDELVSCRYLAYQRGDWTHRVDSFTYHETPEGGRLTTLTDSEWSSINCPTLLVWGEGDRVVPLADGQRLAELIGQSQLQVFSGCGHNPQFELPDVVNPILAEFLSGRRLNAADSSHVLGAGGPHASGGS
jgi:2-hydroxy-6-oxonona-2,4-dienedioate hydrolase